MTEGSAGLEEENQEVFWAQVRIDMGAHRQLWAGEDGKKVSVVGPRALVFSCFLCSSHPLTSFIFIIQRFF